MNLPPKGRGYARKLRRILAEEQVLLTKANQECDAAKKQLDKERRTYKRTTLAIGQYQDIGQGYLEHSEERAYYDRRHDWCHASQWPEVIVFTTADGISQLMDDETHKWVKTFGGMPHTINRHCLNNSALTPSTLTDAIKAVPYRKYRYHGPQRSTYDGVNVIAHIYKEEV